MSDSDDLTPAADEPTPDAEPTAEDEVTAAGADGDEPKKPHSRWLWVSIALAVVSIGLLVWGLSVNSDLDDANTQLEEQAEGGTQVLTEAKSAYDDVAKDLNATEADLAAAEDEIAEANAAAEAAQADADAAKDQVAQAKDDSERAAAEAEQARAEAAAAQSKTEIVADCAKAYVSTLRGLFESEDPKGEAAAVREQLEGISADCKAAYAGE